MDTSKNVSHGPQPACQHAPTWKAARRAPVRFGRGAAVSSIPLFVYESSRRLRLRGAPAARHGAASNLPTCLFTLYGQPADIFSYKSFVNASTQNHFPQRTSRQREKHHPSLNTSPQLRRLEGSTPQSHRDSQPIRVDVALTACQLTKRLVTNFVERRIGEQRPVVHRALNSYVVSLPWGKVKEP